MARHREKKKKGGRIATVMACVLLLAAVGLGALLYLWGQGSETLPSPGLSEDEQVTDDDGFPEVDWDYWLSVNPDIVGWITVPGTTIDNPIVQAHSDDPDYYLHHDIYRNYNPAGTIYLDAECEEDGLSSENAVIMGHHFGYNNPTDYDYEVCPFGYIARYIEEDFATEHATVLIQTPDSKMVYNVRFAQIVNGAEATKRTSFTDEEDYRTWYDEARADAVMVLDADTEPEQTISLVSCSYNIWVSNERTVVTTSEATPVLTEAPDEE